MLAVRDPSENRLNVLMSVSEQNWATQLPRLLAPQGVRSIVVSDPNEAAVLIERQPIHAAVIDAGQPRDPGGLKLLRVIQRLRPTPPAVLVRGRIFDRRTDNRLLSDALKLDAFSVLDQPVELEQVLDVLRRLLERHYGGQWPASS
ncbi:MAG: hypothetical protein GC162_13785 [Planctomycetes bacterium]|nr:hypothetical protein [Planctomycetota bacterium]